MSTSTQPLAVDGRTIAASPGMGSFWRDLQADIVAHVPVEQRGMSAARWFWKGLLIVLRSGGFHLSLAYRTARAARQRFGIPGRAAAGLITWFSSRWWGCTLAPGAEIGGGLILPHPVGIVVGNGVIVGPRAWIFHHVTLGGSPGKEGMPVIGSDARIYTGAVVAGPVVIGDGVGIGANSVVTCDVPSGVMVRPPKPSLG